MGQRRYIDNCDKYRSLADETLMFYYGVAYNQTELIPSFVRDVNLPLKVDTNSILLKKTIDEFLVGYQRAHQKLDSWENKIQNIYNKVGFGPDSYIVHDSKLRAKRAFNSTVEISGDDIFKYDFDMMSYLKPKLSFLALFDVSVVYGSFFFIFIILLAFSQFMKLMAVEKDQKLRKSLIPFGLSGLSYWSNYIIFALVFNLILSIFIFMLGFCMRITVFVEAPAFIIFFVIFVTSLAYSFLAMVIVAYSDDFKTANKITYTLIITSIFLQIFFCQRGALKLFFLEERLCLPQY